MASWQNWSGKVKSDPWRLHSLRSEADAIALAHECSKQERTLRVVGAGHSHMPLVPNSGVIADCSGLTGLISVDTATKTAEVWAGSAIYSLGHPLRSAGLALANQGDIDRQAIVGATATGTHGTGVTLGNLSAAVIGATIATSGGDLVTCSESERPELWRAAQLHLGALGVITRLRLQLVDAYRLREEAWEEPLDKTLAEINAHQSQNRHFEFFWFPQTDIASAKTANITFDEPSYPVGREGSRVAWNYEVLPNTRDWPHTEMEYSVSASDGPECMRAIRELFQKDFPEIPWPVEYRTVAQDDVWLSPAHMRPTVTISVHVDVEVDDTPLFDACEEIFTSFDGRPHWGKVNSKTQEDFASYYPRWNDWWKVRDELDPTQTFLNDYLRSVRP